MPNHVTNKVEFFGNQKNIDKVLELIRGDDERPVIDFNKIIPIPDNIYLGNLGREEREKYGENNWYDWRITHWGTKWNAYDQYSEGNVIMFNTAWSMPWSIYDKLAEICANNDVTFEGAWVNEDWMADSGQFESDIDGLVYIYQDKTEEQAIERCKELWNYDPTDEEY